MAKPYSTGANIDARSVILASQGDAALNRLANIRQRRQERRSQAAENIRRLTHVGGGQFFNPYTQETVEVPGFREREQAALEAEQQRRRELIDLRHQYAMEEAKQRARQTPSGLNKKIRELEGTLRRGEDTLAKAQEIEAKGGSFQSPMLDIVGDVLPSSAEQALRSYALTDEEKEVRMRMERTISQIRKSELGSALTAYEAKLGQNWNPLAPGISQRDSILRFRNLLDEMQAARDALSAGYNVAPIPQVSAPAKGQMSPADAEIVRQWQLLQQSKGGR